MFINKNKIRDYFDNFNIENNHPVTWMKRIYSDMIGISWSIRLIILLILISLILTSIILTYVAILNKGTEPPITNTTYLSGISVPAPTDISSPAQGNSNVLIHIDDGSSISFLTYVLRDSVMSGISQEEVMYIYSILLPSQLSKINYTRSQEGYDTYLTMSSYIRYLSIIISELSRHEYRSGHVGKMHLRWNTKYRDISELSIRSEVQLKDDYINYTLGIMELTDSIIEAQGHYRSGIKRFYSTRLSEYHVQQGLLRLDKILD